MTKTFRGQIVEVGNFDEGGTGMVIEVKGQSQKFPLDPLGTREAGRWLYEFVTIRIDFPDGPPDPQQCASGT